MNDSSPRHQLRIPASPRSSYQAQTSPYVHSPRKIMISSPRRNISTSLSPMTQPSDRFFANSPKENGKRSGIRGSPEKLPSTLAIDVDSGQRFQKVHDFEQRSPRWEDVGQLEQLPFSSRLSISSSSSPDSTSLAHPKLKPKVEVASNQYPSTQEIFYYSQKEREDMAESVSMREYLEETVSDILLNGRFLAR